MHRIAVSWGQIAWGLLFFCGSIALIRDTYYVGHDFAVFWRAAGFLLTGEPIYSVARDGAMVFKYPPWIAVFFVPLAVLPLSLAKACWGVIQVISLIFIVRWLLNHGVRKQIVFATTLVFWGIWVVHAMDGQVNLVMLAIALWTGDHIFQKSSGWKLYFLFVALSTKIFTLFPFLGRRRPVRFSALLAGGLVCFLLAAPALRGSGSSPLKLFHAWQTAASSGDQLAGEKIRGRDNQGLPAAAIRALGLPAREKKADIVFFFFFATILGSWWRIVSKKMKFEEAWVGWLALIPVVHPLAWFHLFVFTFPLAATTLERSWGSYLNSWKRGSQFVRANVSLWLAVFGTLLITVVTVKTFGHMGHQAEMLSIKSLGTLLCLWSLIRNV